MLSPEKFSFTKPFSQVQGVAEPERKGVLIHWICTSRVRPVRGKGLSHLAVVFDPNIHSLLHPSAC
jgi:hypothetical protein